MKKRWLTKEGLLKKVTPYPKPSAKPNAKKRKKKTTRQLLVRDLDKIVREIVFQRDPSSVNLIYKVISNEDGVVEPAINKSGVDQLGHIISRGKVSVRWDLRNCHKQDASDNLLHEYYPEVYTQWFIDGFGLDTWRNLVDDSRPVTKYSIDDLETLYIELVEIQKRQQSDPNWKPYFSQKQIITGEWRNE